MAFLPGFRARFAGEARGPLDWPPLAEVHAPVRVRVYDPEDRAAYRGGVRPPRRRDNDGPGSVSARGPSHRCAHKSCAPRQPAGGRFSRSGDLNAWTASGGSGLLLDQRPGRPLDGSRASM